VHVMRSVALVVMEHGSAWPGGVNQWDVDVVAFGPPHGVPHERVRRACERSARQGRVLELAVLACNAEAHEEAIGRRAATARSLVAAVLPARSGRVILSACRDAAPSLRDQLIGLAGTLTESLRGSSASVSVHFDAGPAGELRPPRKASGSPRVAGFGP
jgi:hypothetical protein